MKDTTRRVRERERDFVREKKDDILQLVLTHIFYEDYILDVSVSLFSIFSLNIFKRSR